MAGITTRSLARLLTSLSTTPTLRTSATSVRTIASFNGLRSLAEPGRIPTETVEKGFFMNEHLEALSVWHEEAEKMRELRLSVEGSEMKDIYSEQVVEILEDLMEDGLLDPRTGWLEDSHA